MLNETFSVIFKHCEEANLKWVNALIIFTFILKKKSVIAKGQGRIVLILVKQYHYEDLIDTDDVIYLGWHSSPTAWPPDDFSRKKGLRFGLKSRLATAEPFCSDCKNLQKIRLFNLMVSHTQSQQQAQKVTVFENHRKSLI